MGRLFAKLCAHIECTKLPEELGYAFFACVVGFIVTTALLLGLGAL